MSKEKLDVINNVFSKVLPIESTTTSEHMITFLFKDNKSTTLDFNQDYLRHLKIENIPTMIKDFKLIDLISNSNYKIISISEKGAIPYHKKK